MASPFAEFAKGFFDSANSSIANRRKEEEQKRLMQEKARLDQDNIRASQVAQWEESLSKQIQARGNIEKDMYKMKLEQQTSIRDNAKDAVRPYLEEVSSINEMDISEDKKQLMINRARFKHIDATNADPEEFDKLAGIKGKGQTININEGGDLSNKIKTDLQTQVISATRVMEDVRDLGIDLDKSVEWNFQNSKLKRESFGTPAKMKKLYEDLKITPLVNNPVGGLIANGIGYATIGQKLEATPEEIDNIVKAEHFVKSMRSAMRALVDDKGSLAVKEQEILGELTGEMNKTEFLQSPERAFSNALESAKFIRGLGEQGTKILKKSNVFSGGEIESLFSSTSTSIGQPMAQEVDSVEKARELLKAGQPVRFKGKLINPPKQ